MSCGGLNPCLVAARPGANPRRAGSTSALTMVRCRTCEVAGATGIVSGGTAEPLSGILVIFSFIFLAFYKIVEQLVVPRMETVFQSGFGTLRDGINQGIEKAFGSFDADVRRQAIIQISETSTKLTRGDFADIGHAGLRRSYGYENRLGELELNYMSFLHNAFLNSFFETIPVYYGSAICRLKSLLPSVFVDDGSTDSTPSLAANRQRLFLL